MKIFRVEIFIQYLIKLLPYARVTITYTVGALFFGYLVGLCILKMKKSKYRVLNVISHLYITVFRSVPTIVLLFLIYFGIPSFLKSIGINVSNGNKLVYIIITFTFIIGASSSEIMRSAYEAVSKGQYEAAVSVGLTPVQAFFRIIFPQAVVVALPNVGNNIVFLLKDGALAYTIGLNDIYGGGLYLSSLDYQSYLLEVYAAMTVFYWPVSEIITRLVNWIDRRISIEYKINKMRKAAEL